MLGNGSFMLRSGETTSFIAPQGWLGTWGARTGCQFDNSTAGSCETGQCSPTFKCYNANVAPYTQAGPSMRLAGSLLDSVCLTSPQPLNITRRYCR